MFLRREAIARGYVDRDLKRALRDGAITRIRHGAYAPTPIWESAGPEEQHLLRVHAVARSHASPIAISHTSAAIVHGLRTHEPDLRQVSVTCLGRRLARTTPGVVYHHGDAADREVVERHGLLVVEPARAAVETASLGSLAQGMVVMDAVLDQGLATPEDLKRCLERRAGWPHSRKLQMSGRLVRLGSNSVGESLARHLMWRAHLPEPVLQFAVLDQQGRLLGRTDFAWPEHGLLGEFDGMAKYGRLLGPGQSAGDAITTEKVREDRLREATGWLMVRLVWRDLFDPATPERLRRQLARAQQLLAERRR